MQVTESAMLCLESWRGRVIAARQKAGGGAPKTLLSGVRDDPGAFDFVRDIFDYVELPQDAFAAALGLHELSQETPESLPARLRLALRVGGIASFGLPWGVLPVVKKRFHAHLDEILVASELPELPESPESLELSALNVEPDAPLKTPTGLKGLPANADLELHGAPVVGPAGVLREVERLRALVRLDGVKRLSVSPARFVPGSTEWQLDELPAALGDALHELLADCDRHGVAVTFVARSYAEALAMPAIVRAVHLDARCATPLIGVEVLAELPESIGIIRELAEVAEATRPLEVRLTTRSIAREATIDSLERGLAVPVMTEPEARDAAWLRAVDELLASAGDEALLPVVASEDAVLLAVAQVRTQQRRAGSNLQVALYRGRAPELEAVLQASGANVQIMTTLVAPAEFAHALPEVLETLSLVASDHSPLALTERVWNEAGQGVSPDVRQRIVQLHELALDEAPASHRLQDRSREWEPSERDSPLMYRPPADAHRFDTGGLTAQVMQLHRDAGARPRVHTDAPQRVPLTSDTGFACEPDTDVAQKRNRSWVLAQAARGRHSEIGVAAAEAAETGAWALDAVIERAAKAGALWAAWAHTDRATTVRRGSLALVAARDRLIEVLVAERGSPLPEIDGEIGYAIDSARYLASRAEGLRTVRGATFAPQPLSLIAADEHTSFGELAEMVFAVLSAGSGVVIAAHPTLARTASVLLEELGHAGLPEATATLMTPGPGESFDEFVLRVTERAEFVQGMYVVSAELARAVQRRAPSLRRDIRARSQGTVMVTQSADSLAAVPTIVRSALAGAGGHHRSARAIVLVGTLARSDAFLDTLADAVNAVVVGHSATADASATTITMGPLPAPPTPAGLRALTTLEQGESWLVQPRQLDDEGRLWSPGVRVGVRPDAEFWGDSVGVPVIGVVRAMSMHDALVKQGEIGGRATAALWSLDGEEIVSWLESTKAAALAVNRGTTGARVERFPSGEWHNAQSTWQPLAGGPHRLIPLGEWSLRRGTQSDTLHLRGLDPVVQHVIETVQPLLSYTQFDVLRRAALADELAWRTQFGTAHDASGLSTEHNLLRYRRVAVHLRLATTGDVGALIRLLIAGLLSSSALTVSSGLTLPKELVALLELHQISYVYEGDETWIERASLEGSAVSGAGEVPAARIRLIGGEATRVTEWLSSRDDVSVWARPVTMAGPIELLGFVKEQAVSIERTRHGFQAPIDELEEWLDELKGQ